MADWEDLTPKKTASDGGWEDLAPKKPKTLLDSYEENVPAPIRGAIGGIEGLGAGAIGMVEGMGRAIGGAAQGLWEGGTFDAMSKGAQQGLSEVKVRAQTELGKLAEGAIGDFFHAIGETAGDINRADIDLFMKSPEFQKLSPEKQKEWARAAAMQQTFAEAGTNMELYRQGTVSPLRGVQKGLDARKAEAARKAQYEKEQAISNAGWEDLVRGEEAKVQDRAMQDMSAQARDTGNMAGDGFDTPMRGSKLLPPERIVELEKELNPATDYQRDGRQGELFTEERAYTPDELAGRRFTLDEAGSAKKVRDIEEPTQTNPDRNLGVEDQQRRDLDPYNPTTSQQPIGFGGTHPENGGAVPFKRALDPNRPNQANRRAALEAEVNKDRPSQSFWENENTISEKDLTTWQKLGKVPKRQRGMFIGPMAHFQTKFTLNRGFVSAARKALKTAGELEKRGDSKEHIYDATGWFRGKDGKWRTETSDRGAALKTDKLERMWPNAKNPDMADTWHGPKLFTKTPMVLSDLLDHPSLFEAYPHLKDMPVKSTGMSIGLKGYFDPSTQTMALGGGKKSSMLSTLLHEVQHAIQHYEKWVNGGSPKEPKNMPALKAEKAVLEKGLKSLYKRAGISEKEISAAQQRVEMALSGDWPYSGVEASAVIGLEKVSSAGLLKPMLRLAEVEKMIRDGGSKAYRDYRRIAGEVEARATEARHWAELPEEPGHISTAGPKEKYPWDNYDVEIDDMTIPGKSEGASMSVDPTQKKFDKTTKKEGLAAALIEARKQFQSDYGKTLAEAMKDKPLDPKTIEDFGSQSEGMMGRFKNIKDGILTHTMIDRSLSILAQSKTGLGRLVKWAVDNREGIETIKDVAVRDGVKQALEHWKHTPHAELRGMLDVWTSNIGKGELTRSSFKSDTQYRTFLRTRDYLNGFLDKINAKREKYGLEKIPRIQNYLPAIWEGDYRIWIKDGMGNNKGVFGFKTIYQAQHAYKELVKAHPELIVEQPIHKKTEIGDINARVLKDAGRQRGINNALSNDLSAFEEALKVMTKNDPVTKSLQATYAKLITTKGFNKSLLERKNLFGYLGFEKGDLGVRNMERAIEMYIKRGENHMANLDKSDIYRQIAELPQELRSKIPNGLDYLEDYLSMSRGASLSKDGLIAPIASAFSRFAGFGESGVGRGISNLSSWISMALLARPGFVISNMAQHINILPKLVDLGQLDKAVRNPVSSYFNGMLNAYSPKGIREKVAQEWVDWAGQNGFLESSIVSMLNMKFSDMAYEKGNAIMDAGRWVLGKVERDTVRVQAGLIVEYALRDSTPNKAERFAEAARLMNHYMVAYDTASIPLVYHKAGEVVGGLTRPLKQYSHNAFGQFLEFAQVAKDQQRYAPLASYFAVQAAVGGLKGTILIAEATAIVGLINMMFGQNYPTPEELMRKGTVQIRDKYGKVSGNLADMLVTGGYSTVLGFDISSSVNAPNLPQMFQLAPLEYTAKAASTAWTYFTHKLKGTATEQDLMAALLASSPTAMRGWIEEYFRKPNGIVPNPNRKMQGDYHRDEKYIDGFGLGEKGLAMLSLKSLKESNTGAIDRLLRAEFARVAEMKMETIDAIADRVMSQEKIGPDLIQRYIEEGGDPKNLAQDIRDRIKKRALTFQEQQYQGQMTLQKADKLKRMTEYLNKNSEKPAERKKEDASPYIKPMKNNYEEPTSFQTWYSVQSEADKQLIRKHLKSKGIILPPSDGRGSRMPEVPRDTTVATDGGML